MSIKKYLEEDNNIILPKSGDIYARLQQDILTGKRKRGSKLTESALCAEYGVSRTPLRHAIGMLASDGLVESIPNKGSFVIGLSAQDIDDLNELRRVTETIAAGRAAVRMTDDERARLSETFSFMEFYTARDDIPKMLSINLAFHKIIHEGTHNDILLKQLDTYQHYLGLCDPANYYMPGFLREILSEHRDICDGILSEDPKAASSAMEKHMVNALIRKRQR